MSRLNKTALPVAIIPFPLTHRPGGLAPAPTNPSESPPPDTFSPLRSASAFVTNVVASILRGAYGLAVPAVSPNLEVEEFQDQRTVHLQGGMDANTTTSPAAIRTRGDPVVQVPIKRGHA
ncbi:hypothetical protein M407DRAFT_5607 [Tulasnella calospora MUT 4182]|uniref:Uncharacterized protein n=1 Tax=Tulasnella calospora MUT 4182 TaxID=1051891 RepID=A0A0C3QRT1_9AGAM|nr:hypothetical protein M407DRAFT_5607 [Tulasnella calospora MUT 4182]